MKSWWESSEEGTYSWVTKRALSDSLEKRRLSHVGQSNNTRLKRVAWTSKEDLLLLHFLLWRHLFAISLCVGTGLCDRYCAVKQSIGGRRWAGSPDDMKDGGDALGTGGDG